jgi:flagellar FliL protein
MADESVDKKKEGKEGEKAPAKKSKKKLFIIVGAVVVVLLIAGGSYFFLFSGGGGEEGADEHAEASEDDGHGGKKEVKKDSHGNVIEASSGPEILKFDPFIVNLTNTAGNRYLKISISLEMESAAAEESRGKTAQIRDSIITLLSSKSYADVGSVSGKYQLRDEIAARINLIVTEGKVKSVYFTEFVNGFNVKFFVF